MNHEVNVILAKASWCPHCIHFTPIFNETGVRFNKKNYLKRAKVDFLSYDLANDEEKNQFENKYPELSKSLSGYPTVFFQLKKENARPKTLIINHSVVEKDDEEGRTKAINEFIDNITDAYKNALSDRVQQIRVQNGGNNNNRTSLEIEKYRNKYLKYKRKYLDYKNSIKNL
jgi:thiol-disulfide isomerase/thioredoxin